MRVVRETAIAMTKPKEILGVPRTAFVFVTALAFLIVDKVNVHLGIFVWVGLCAAVRALVKKYPRILKIFWVARKFKPIYDPMKRENFAILIIEDETPSFDNRRIVQ